MIVQIPIWSNNINEYLTLINSRKNDISKVFINCLNDIDYARIGNDTTFLDNCLYLCNDFKIPVILASMYSEKFNPKLRDFNLPKNFDFKRIEWETYWFFRTFISMAKLDNNTHNINLNLNIFNNSVNYDTSFKYTYVCLNNLAKKHRCMLMDNLAKHDMLNSGAIAWRDVVRGLDNIRHLIPEGVTDSDYCSENNILGYKYQYWKPKIMLLDQKHVHNIDNQEILPKEYNESLFQIVTETDTDTFIISEKTVVPLLFNKPFLSLACVNFHRNLEKLGFKLYDELFDYSFDEDTSLLSRINGIVNNVIRIKNLSLQEQTNLFEIVKFKLQYNRLLSLQMVFNNIPNDLQILAKEMEETTVNFHSEVRSIVSINEYKKYIH